MWGDGVERGFSTAKVWDGVSVGLEGEGDYPPNGTYFCFDVPEVDAELLHQAWLVLVAFCAECSKPSCSQTHLLTHSTGDIAHLSPECGWGAAIVAIRWGSSCGW